MAAAILLSDAGKSVVLFEKQQYPFHRVCGEYLSRESVPFLRQIGLSLDWSNLPTLTTLQLTTSGNHSITRPLPTGGLGVSRYTLDHSLAVLAKEKNVTLLENTRVIDVHPDNGIHTLVTSQETYTARVVLGAFGKRSNLDRALNRDLPDRSVSPAENYVGVKYHIQAALPPTRIQLHLFPRGYCGVSPVDGGRTCFCYLTTAENLRRSGGSIHRMEQEILAGNSNLAEYLNNFTSEYEDPLVISQIHFKKKPVVEKHILMLGDAAAMIAPLTGNGMSMALRSATLAVPFVLRFLEKRITREAMETGYAGAWEAQFSGRLRLARILQNLMFSTRTGDAVFQALETLRLPISPIIKRTHGDPFYINR